MTSRRRHAAPPPLLRRALLALGVAAVAVGCTAVTEGTAQRSAEDAIATTAPGITTTSTSSAPPTVTTAELINLLLKRSELAEIVADRDLDLFAEFNELTISGATVRPFGCRGIVLAPQARAAAPTTRAIRGNGYRGADGQAVTQIVMSVESPEAVARGMSVAEANWSTCPLNEIFTMETQALGTQEWLLTHYSHSNSPAMLTATVVRQSDEPRECSHIFRAVSNVFVEGMVCGRSGESAAQTAAVVDRIVKNITT